MNNILKSKIKDLFNTGFFYILGSSFLNKIIAFITNAVLTRILTKEEMGIFSGAFNAYFIVYLFSGLGITSGMLYFCAKDKEWAEKNSYYNFSFWFGMISEVILSAILVFYGLYNKSGILESRKYMVGLAILPFVSFFFDYYSIILRAEKDNKHYSIISNLNTVFYLIFGVLGALFGRIWGTIIGRYLAFIVSDIIGHCFCKQYVNFHKSNKLGYEKTKDLVKYSLKAGLTSSLNVILYRLDVTVIDLVLADASILAAYKIGTTLPENMNFIPQCFMIYFMPLFLQHIKEQEWIKKKTKEVYLVIGAVSIVLGLIMYLFAPIIISIIWDKPEGMRSHLSKTAMLALAVTIHNLPEGMAVGVVFAGADSGATNISLASALAVALGIAIQNVPEGAIISMPMRAAGNSPWRSFIIGSLSGVVEPVGAIAVLLLASLLLPVLPYMLAFAAGAMFYVVVEELIPEASSGQHSNLSTIGFAVGFVLMMVLDVVITI